MSIEEKIWNFAHSSYRNRSVMRKLFEIGVEITSSDNYYNILVFDTKSFDDKVDKFFQFKPHPIKVLPLIYHL